MAASCARRSTPRSFPGARSLGRLARSAPLLSLLLLLLLLAPAAPAGAIASAATAAAGTVQAVIDVAGDPVVAGDESGDVYAVVGTRIVAIRPDGSTAVLVDAGKPVYALAGDPSSDDVYFHDGEEILRVHDGAIELVARLSGMFDVGPNGTVYIADENGIHRVRDDGSLETVHEFTGGGGSFAVGADGSFAVADFSQIWISRPGGELELVDELPPCPALEDPCGDGGSVADARFAGISDLAFDAAGRLSVSSAYRVRVIDLDGTVRHVAGRWESPFNACGAPGCPLTSAAQEQALYPIEVDIAGSDLVVGELRGRILRVVQPLDAPRIPTQGYRMIASDGGVFTFGWGGFHGSTGDLDLVSPIVAGRSNGAGGYWFVAGDGGVFTFGDAGFFGSAAGHTTSPVVDMAVRRDGRGYYLAERNGTMRPFGMTMLLTAPEGPPFAAVVNIGPNHVRPIAERPSSLPRLNVPVVAAHGTRSGNGIWYVASDGGVFTEGDAGFFGSTGAMRLNQPVFDLIPTPSEQGYWLIAADGGVFTFGDAAFLGSMGAVRLNQPVVAGVAGPVASG